MKCREKISQEGIISSSWMIEKIEISIKKIWYGRVKTDNF